MTAGLDRETYRALIETRIFEPDALVRALTTRRRRTVAGSDGRLLIIAADNPEVNLQIARLARRHFPHLRVHGGVVFPV